MSMVVFVYISIGLMLSAYFITLVYRLGMMGHFIEDVVSDFDFKGKVSDTEAETMILVFFTLLCVIMWPVVLMKFFEEDK